MSQIKVLSPGSKVRIIEPEIEGRITAFSVRGDKRLLKYEVAWWDGQNRHCSWFEKFEIEKADDRRKTKVGFNNS